MAIGILGQADAFGSLFDCLRSLGRTIAVSQLLEVIEDFVELLFGVALVVESKEGMIAF